MRIQVVSVAVATVFAIGSLATPLAKPGPATDDLVLDHTEDVDGVGSISYYKAADESLNRRLVSPVARELTEAQKQEIKAKITCPSTETPSCDNENGGSENNCKKLMDDLKNNADVAIPDGILQVCQGESDDKCCIKWTNPMKVLHKSDLVGPLEKTQEECTENGISGKFRQIWLSQACVSVCVNNGHPCKHKATGW